jgi:hypothetical protein
MRWLRRCRGMWVTEELRDGADYEEYDKFVAKSTG